MAATSIVHCSIDMRDCQLSEVSVSNLVRND